MMRKAWALILIILTLTAFGAVTGVAIADGGTGEVPSSSDSSVGGGDWVEPCDPIVSGPGPPGE